MSQSAGRQFGYVIAAILLVAGGAGWIGWMRQPAGGATVVSDAVVTSVAYPPDGRSRPIAGLVSLKLDNGGQASFYRSVRCLPRVKVGDRIRLVGRQIEGGGISWSIAGEPCPA